jgi:hypothetical protein
MPGSRSRAPFQPAFIGWLFLCQKNSSINFHEALNALGETVVLYW